MKKTALLITIIFVILSVNGKAEDNDKKVAKGIRAGFNSSSCFENGSKLSNTKHHHGYYLGVYGESRIIPFLRFGSGLEYHQNGIKIDHENKIEYHYLNVPLYLKTKVGPVFALTGIAPGLKLSEQRTFSDGDPFEYDKAKSFDLPFFIGGGVKILLFSIEARYHWGITEMYENIHNHYLEIGASVSF